MPNKPNPPDSRSRMKSHPIVLNDGFDRIVTAMHRNQNILRLGVFGTIRQCFLDDSINAGTVGFRQIVQQSRPR